MIANSYDRMSIPTGIIQNPRTGKKPKTPRIINVTPIAMRLLRDRGIVMSRLNTEITRLREFSSVEVSNSTILTLVRLGSSPCCTVK